MSQAAWLTKRAYLCNGTQTKPKPNQLKWQPATLNPESLAGASSATHYSIGGGEEGETGTC
uniref:Uncharacterized protein n=1 Tax=Thermogemmatispora argillosa TaxID=2045280 RepID=A0A455SW92_9CHLR|nr:hypothetical protein KTA_08360 [Thermogemmatispora argillosa]